MRSLSRLERLERLQDYFVNNDHSVEHHQGPVELDPRILYSDDEIEEDVGCVVRRKHGGVLLDSSDVAAGLQAVYGPEQEEVDDDGRIGTMVYSSSCSDDDTDDDVVVECGKNDDARGHDGTQHGWLSASCAGQDMVPVSRGCHISERLLARHGKKRDADVQRWKEEAEKEFREQCTFAPGVMEDAVKQRLRRESVLYNIPIEKRISIEWRRKEERLLDATRRADVGVTFTPEINRLSRQIAAKRRERGMQKRLESVEERATSHACASQKVFTCRHSEDILNSSGCIPREFQDRQEYFQSKYQRNASMLRAVKEEQAGMFRAHIPPDMLVSSNRLVRQMLESREERFDRMAHGDAAAIEARRLKRKQELDAQFRFRPDLNKKSLEMASSGVAGTSHTMSQRMQEYRQGKYNECSFRPDTSKPRVRGFYCSYKIPDGNSKYSISTALREGTLGDFLGRYVEEKQRKAQLAQEARAERLSKELQECSFAPKINKKIVTSAEGEKPLHLMPGMQGFFQNLELIEKKQADLAEREKSCFVQTDHWTPAPTVVQPFNLSYSQLS